jgi:hypothetical protein
VTTPLSADGQPIEAESACREGGDFGNPGAFRSMVIAPRVLVASNFSLEPLGPEHNERDHPAWMTSLEHIHATPGFTAADWAGDSWPFEMSLEANLADLTQHAVEFETGQAFAFTVVDAASDDVIGCVYIDPDDTGVAEAMCRSWVRASHAALDGPLHDVVRAWLAGPLWPFASVRFPGR